jgi:hypothetical protein
VNAPTGTPLPASYRWALVAAVVVGFQVALSAAIDLQAVLNLDEPAPVRDQIEMPGLQLSPEAQRELWLASVSGYRGALEGMRPWRLATSALLSIAAGLVFFIGVRLRVVPQGRAEIAQRLATAAVAVAVLRSIDGAQNLVAVRSATEQMMKVLVKAGLPDADGGMTTGAMMAGSIGWSVVMVGLFVGLSSYFRSDTVRLALERAEP